MKIGIITFHWADNCGAVLQAYALSRSINETKEGCDAEIVDYVCLDCVKPYRPFVFENKTLKGLIIGILRGVKNFPFWVKKHYGFVMFRKLIPISKRYSKVQLFNGESDYDVWITGSDQVWNTGFVGNDYDIYDLSFVKSKKKCSYAASSGVFTDKLNDIQRAMISDINDLDYISVREKTTQQYLEKRISKSVERVLDPTFLIDRTKWSQLAGNKRIHSRDYLFVYFVTYDKNILEVAGTISRALGLDIVVCGYSKEFRGKAVQYRSASPTDFLNLVMNSKYVLASSFHATAFSLIFEKQFLALIPAYASNRVVDLCELIGLRNRVIQNSDGVKALLGEEIDYDAVRCSISNKKSESLQFINMLLQDNA